MAHQLTSNTTKLEELKAKVQALPAGKKIQESKTVAPSTSSQTVTPDSGYDGLAGVTVNAIPSSYIEPTATKAATTYTPTTSNQTIAAGTYCSGTQTIKGDANLVAGNIKSGVSIFGVAGSYEGSGGGSGGGATATFTFTTDFYLPGTYDALFIQTANGISKETISDRAEVEYEIVVPSMVTIYATGYGPKSTTGNIELIGSAQAANVYYATGDCSLTLYG